MIKEITRYSDSNIMEGMVSVRAVLDSMNSPLYTRRILEILYSEDRAKDKPKELAWLSYRAQEYGFKITLTPHDRLDEISIGHTHAGVLACCTDRTIPSLSMETYPQKARFAIMLEGIEDPYNFGYALRTFYAAGVDAVILPPRNWMSAAGVVCRASAGASERLDLFVSDAASDAAAFFKNRGDKVICADIKNSVSVYDADLSLPLFLIVGGEKRGISSAVLSQADEIVRLDYARTFSCALSAASAASILAYEVFRKNRGK